MKEVEIYTDGACSGNPGPGGYAAILLYKGNEKTISGFKEQTTNNIMEMTGVYEALQCLKEPCIVKLYSDSAYVINAFEKGWIYGWKKNGWMRKGSKDKLEELKNAELWKALYEQHKVHQIEWIKVKGHADNTYNNMCDKLAVDEIKKNKKE